MAEGKAQIASLEGMKKKEQKKVLRRMTKEVMKDKRYRRAIRRNPEPISKKAAQAAAGAAVDAVLGVHTGKPAVPPKKTGLEIYADIVHAVVGAYRKKQKKYAKIIKKEGYDAKTGYIVLGKLKPAKKAKLNKPYKAKKPKK